MADPLTLAAVGSFIASVGSVAVPLLTDGNRAPSMPGPTQTTQTTEPTQPRTPDPEVAKRNSTDRRRERLRSVASGNNTNLTGGQGLGSETQDEDDTSGRSRKTILGR